MSTKNSLSSVNATSHASNGERLPPPCGAVSLENDIRRPSNSNRWEIYVFTFFILLAVLVLAVIVHSFLVWKRSRSRRREGSEQEQREQEAEDNYSIPSGLRRIVVQSILPQRSWSDLIASSVASVQSSSSPTNIMVEDVLESQHEMEGSLSKPQSSPAPCCPICLEPFSKGVPILGSNNCCHIFHHDCVLQWTSQSKDECPLCRQKLWDEATYQKRLQEELESSPSSSTEDDDNSKKHIQASQV